MFKYNALSLVNVLTLKIRFLNKRLYALAFILLTATSIATEKPLINVTGEAWLNSTNSDGTGTYFEIVKAIYGNEYEIKFTTTTWERAIKMVENGRANILVGSYPEPNPSLIYSEHHIDTEHPVLFIFDPSKISPTSVDDLNGKMVAVKKGWGLESFLPEQAKFYGTNTVSSLIRLIEHDRVDGALVYRYNLKLADPEGKLSYIEIAPALPIYLAFTNNPKGKLYKELADTQFPVLLENNKIEPLFPSKAEFAHANFQENKTDSINWFLVPKLLNVKTEELEVNPWEFKASKQIVQSMHETTMVLKTASFAETKKQLLSHRNTCSINLRKPKDLDNSVIYSSPIYAFIPPRLFVLKDSPINETITGLQNNDMINIKKLLDADKELRLVVKDNFSIYNKLLDQLGESYEQRIIDIDRTEYSGVINMLVQKRVDALIIWPSIINDVKYDNKHPDDFVSFALEQPLTTTLYTYVACHNDELGQEVIKRTNALLQTDELIQPMINSMDANSALAFKAALQQ